MPLLVARSIVTELSDDVAEPVTDRWIALACLLCHLFEAARRFYESKNKVEIGRRQPNQRGDFEVTFELRLTTLAPQFGYR